MPGMCVLLFLHLAFSILRPLSDLLSMDSVGWRFCWHSLTSVCSVGDSFLFLSLSRACGTSVSVRTLFLSMRWDSPSVEVYAPRCHESLANATDIIPWTFPTLIIPWSLAMPIRFASEWISISPVCFRGHFIHHVRLREALLQLKRRGHCATVYRNGRSRLLGLILVPNEKTALWLKGLFERRLRLSG
jgi:hypothetical protein